MRIDLFTLYDLAIGTLLLAAAMTCWEGGSQPRRRRQIRLWVTGYVLLACGCLVSLFRDHFAALAAANLVMTAGYLSILEGTARLDGRSCLRLGAIVMAGLAGLWASVGWWWPAVMWAHVSAVAIAIVSGMTGWRLWQGRAKGAPRARPVAATVAGAHGLFYLARATILPLLAHAWGPEIVASCAKLTMYEGVLFSVALPMALIAVIREETQNALLAVSRTDYLTGIGNRCSFFADGAAMLARAPIESPLSLLAFDLDHFKAINDRHGHATGDAVLRAFARTARDAVDTGALLARLGGEEFALLLPDRDGAAARRIGETIGRRFADDVARADGLGITATVSIGLVEVHPEQRDLDALLATADRALYRAKRQGRNRIEIGDLAAA